MNTVIKRILIYLGILLILGVAGCIYSINVPPWLEWDEHDPRLHGQEVMFIEPMVYFSIDPLVWYGIEDVPVSDTLFTREDAKNNYVGIYSLKGHDVIPSTRFTVTKSFWVRQNWWDAAFAGHIHLVILEDSKGKEVVSSFYNFNESNRPELYEFKEKGYIK